MRTANNSSVSEMIAGISSGTSTNSKSPARPTHGPTQLMQGAILAFVVFLSMCLNAPLARAQEQKRPKMPGLDKIIANASHQAFNGIVQSLDTKRSLLNVNTVQGGVTEIFPIKKDTRVLTVDGDRLRLPALTPGTNVLIYFDQKGDRRTVKQIVVLSSAVQEKKPPPKS